MTWTSRALTLLAGIAATAVPGQSISLAAQNRASAAASPEQMVVALTDLPAGFVEVRASKYTAQSLQKKWGATVQRLGMHFDYAVEFDRQYASGNRVGVFEVNDGVRGYNAAVGAHTAFVEDMAGFRAAFRSAGRYDIKAASLPRIGDESNGWKYKAHTKSGGGTATLLLVHWRRGPYINVLIVAAYTASVRPSYQRWLALHLAQLADRRMTRSAS